MKPQNGPYPGVQAILDTQPETAWNVRKELLNLSNALNDLAASELDHARDHVAEGNSHKAAPLFERADAYRDAVDLVESVIRQVPENLITSRMVPGSLRVTPLEPQTEKDFPGKRLVGLTSGNAAPKRGDLVHATSWATRMIVVGILTDESDVKQMDHGDVDLTLVKRLVSRPVPPESVQWSNVWVANESIMQPSATQIRDFNKLLVGSERTLDEVDPRD